MRVQNVNLDQVRTFAAVAEHGNESKAAQKLHLSQSALSHHLKDLQEQFGKLFKRNSRGLELTKRGEALFNEITPILAGFDSVQRKYDVTAGSEDVKALSVGSSYGPATSLMPSVLAAFKERHPPTDIQLRVSNSPDIQELITSSEVDLAVVTNPSPADSLVMEPFKTFRICFFVSPAHPLAASQAVTGQMLARYPLVIGRAKKARSRTDELLSTMAANGVKLNVLMRCEWPDAVKTMVRGGEAVGVLYRDSVEHGVRAGQFKILNVLGVNLSVISYILYPRAKSRSKPAEEFLRFIRSVASSGTTTSHLGKAQHYLLLLFAVLSELADLAFAT